MPFSSFSSAGIFPNCFSCSEVNCYCMSSIEKAAIENRLPQAIKKITLFQFWVKRKEINSIQDTYIFFSLDENLFHGVNEKELWPSYPPCFSQSSSQSYSIVAWRRLWEVLVKNFLMGPLMIGLEGARVSGREHGFPPRSAGLCLAQTPSSWQVPKHYRGITGIEHTFLYSLIVY